MPPRCFLMLSSQRSDRSMSARMLRVDHGQLPGAVEFGGLAEQAETGIVHHDRRLEPGGAHGLRQQQGPIRRAQVGGHHLRARMTGTGDLVSQPLKLSRTARADDQRVAVRRKHA